MDWSVITTAALSTAMIMAQGLCCMMTITLWAPLLFRMCATSASSASFAALRTTTRSSSSTTGTSSRSTTGPSTKTSWAWCEFHRKTNYYECFLMFAWTIYSRKIKPIHFCLPCKLHCFASDKKKEPRRGDQVQLQGRADAQQQDCLQKLHGHDVDVWKTSVMTVLWRLHWLFIDRKYNILALNTYL